MEHNLCTAKMDSCGTSLHVHVTQSFTEESFNKITNFGLLSENGLGETYAFQITEVICDHLELIVVVVVYCIRVYFFGHTMSCDCQSVTAESNIRIFLFFYFLFLYKIKILFLHLLHFTSTYTCRMTIVPRECV